MKRKTLYVDIDGTICTITPDANYANAEPIPHNIEVINDFYKQGCRVIYWTARGTETGIDWRPVTIGQFERWGVLYHGLEFGKPAYDLLIDDKVLHANALKRIRIRGGE